jgi:hypothetical protein
MLSSREPKHIAEKILQALKDDERKRALAVAENIRRRSWDKVSEEILDCLLSTLNQGKQAESPRGQIS